MKETDAFDQETLIRLFPSLEQAIKNGDFKALKMTDSEGKHHGPTIYRFLNMAIRAPNGTEIGRIMELIDTPRPLIITRPYGLLGIEFTAKPNAG